MYFYQKKLLKYLNSLRVLGSRTNAPLISIFTALNVFSQVNFFQMHSSSKHPLWPSKQKLSFAPLTNIEDVHYIFNPLEAEYTKLKNKIIKSLLLPK